MALEPPCSGVLVVGSRHGWNEGFVVGQAAAASFSLFPLGCGRNLELSTRRGCWGRGGPGLGIVRTAEVVTVQGQPLVMVMVWPATVAT